jgi:hypothetical protein
MELCILVCYLIKTPAVKRSRTKVEGIPLCLDTDWTLVC